MLRTGNFRSVALGFVIILLWLGPIQVSCFPSTQICLSYADLYLLVFYKSPKKQQK